MDWQEYMNFWRVDTQEEFALMCRFTNQVYQHFQERLESGQEVVLTQGRSGSKGRQKVNPGLPFNSPVKDILKMLSEGQVPQSLLGYR